MEGYLHLRIAPWLRRLVTRTDRAGAGGRGDRAGRRGVDAAPAGPQPGDPQPAALVRGDPADPLHVEPAEHGGVRDALVGPGPGLADGRDHRRAERQAGARTRSASGCSWRPSRAVRSGRCRCRGWWRRALYGLAGAVAALLGLGDDQALGPPVAGLDARAERPARLGRRAAAPAAGDDRRGPGARPGRRRDPQPGPQPGAARARPSWSCSTWSIRR